MDQYGVLDHYGVVHDPYPNPVTVGDELLLNASGTDVLLITAGTGDALLLSA